MLTKTQLNSLLKTLEESIEEKFGETFTALILFGSYAQKSQSSSSDVDIVAGFNSTLSSSKIFDKLRENIMRLEEKYETEINILISHENEVSKTPLMVGMADYAKILKDENKIYSSLFSSILKDYENNLIKKIKRPNNSFTLWISEAVE